MALCPPYLSAIAPNIGPVSPHINICIPIESPASVNEIPKSSLKSIKNKPKVCLTPNDIRTTRQAAIKVTKAVLFLKNFSLAIFNYFKCLRACLISAIRSLGSSNPMCNLTRCSSFANFKNFRVPVSLYS